VFQSIRFIGRNKSVSRLPIATLKGLDLKPLPIVAKVLAALGSIADPWKIAVWFHFPNPRLAKRVERKLINRAPKDCLDEGQQLIDAARQRQASFVA
jgi:hypothetical protein